MLLSTNKTMKYLHRNGVSITYSGLYYYRKLGLITSPIRKNKEMLYELDTLLKELIIIKELTVPSYRLKDLTRKIIVKKLSAE